VCQVHDVEQPKIALATLDSTYVVAVQVGEFCETLLGETALYSLRAQAPAK
jgi:hypothetical protein